MNFVVRVSRLAGGRGNIFEKSSLSSFGTEAVCSFCKEGALLGVNEKPASPTRELCEMRIGHER